MSPEENKSIVRAWIEAYNEAITGDGSLSLDFDKFIAPDYFDHTNQVDVEGLKQLFEMGFTPFTDWHETIEDITAEGEKVWIRLTYTGKHTGEFMGLAPTGKDITTTAVDVYRVAAGKLAEYWNVTDDLSLMKSMGAVEYTEAGKRLFQEDAE